MTIEEAIDFVQEKIQRENRSEDTDLIIDKRNVTETQKHWIIPYQSKRYLESGDVRFIIFGIKPLAIDKTTGMVDPAINTSSI